MRQYHSTTLHKFFPVSLAAGISNAPSLPPQPTIPASPSSTSDSNDAMLRAIAQLLVEKGVITRDELVERLQLVADPKLDA